MSPQCPEGRPQRLRRRDGSGGGRGAGRGGGGGRGKSVARGAAASAAAFVAKDVLDPDGIVRPLLRGAAERLQNSPSRLLCRAGARYLALDPHPLEVIEPPPADAARDSRVERVQGGLPHPPGAPSNMVDAEPAADEPAVFDELADVDDDTGGDAVAGGDGAARDAVDAGDDGGGGGRPA